VNRVVAALASGILALFPGCFHTPLVTPEVLRPGEYCTGLGLNGALSNRSPGVFGWSSIYGRYGLAGDCDVGLGYSFPLGFCADFKRQLGTRPLSAADICLQVGERQSLSLDSGLARPRCWVVGLAPSVAAGRADLYGGAQVLLQVEMLHSRPDFYLLPGFFGGAAFFADDNPFRIVPSLGLLFDPGFGLHAVQALITAGVAVQIDLSELYRKKYLVIPP